MKIVIVGGGAGGLELATKLGRKLGRKGRAEVLLIDKNHTHLWKPLLHEVATGTLDYEMDAVSYRAHGHSHGFRFRIGTLQGINRDQKTVQLGPLLDETGEQILPERSESYDILVLAIGSVSNDFGVTGNQRSLRFLRQRRTSSSLSKTVGKPLYPPRPVAGDTARSDSLHCHRRWRGDRGGALGGAFQCASVVFALRIEKCHPRAFQGDPS